MWIDNASDIDVLFYEPYADVISEMALNKNYKPLTIGVFGVWGAGKSTLLNLIEQKVKTGKSKENKTICVNINAWAFEGYEDAKVAVMESLLQELKKEAPENIKTKIKKLLKKVDFFKLTTKTVGLAAPIAGSIATGNPLPMIISFNSSEDIGNGIKKASKAIQTIREEYIKDDNAVSEESSVVNNVRTFRKEFEDALNNNDLNNVVVLIDDLDRCQPERIIETLEAIKLFLAVNKTTFIIAADENVIQYAIRKKYPPVNNTEVNLDREYIEKIIQLPIYIPELSSRDIENYLMLLVAQQYCGSEQFLNFIKKVKDENIMVTQALIDYNKLLELTNDFIDPNNKDSFNKTAEVIAGIKNIVSENLKGNPRQAKRFLNTFITKRKLANIYYKNDEINEKILAKLLVLQKINPDLFIQLNEWNKNYTTKNEEFASMRVSVTKSAGEEIEKYKSWYVPSIVRWLNCEPKELEVERLDKYFFLTRESLKKSDIVISTMSEKVKDILQRIGNVRPGLMKNIADDIKHLNASDQEDFVKVLLPQIEQGELQYYVVREVFSSLPAYRQRMADALSKTKKKIKPGDIPTIRAMRKLEKNIIDDLIETWKAKQFIVSTMYDDLKKEN